MQNKDKDDGIEDSPLDMLLVILLEGASKEEVVVVTPSSQNPTFFHSMAFVVNTNKFGTQEQIKKQQPLLLLVSLQYFRSKGTSALLLFFLFRSKNLIFLKKYDFCENRFRSNAFVQKEPSRCCSSFCFAPRI